MKYLRSFFNLAFVTIGTISLLVIIPAIYEILTGSIIFEPSFYWAGFILFVVLILGYFVNRPTNERVLRSFYLRKWLLVLALVLVALFHLWIAFQTSVLEFGRLPFELRKLPTSVGECVVWISVITMSFVVYRYIWRCPACKQTLATFNTNAGIGIAKCPRCSKNLVQT